MSAPIIYRSDDVNAPVLDGIKSLNALLYACLCTGYGEKPGAGWSRPFADATETRACYRPGAGTRFFLAVNQTTTSNGYANIGAFELMTSEDAGSFPFGAFENVRLSNSSNTTARSWVLVASDSWMFFISHYAQGALPTHEQIIGSISSWAGVKIFFGDIDKFFPDDGYNCLFSCATILNTSGIGNASLSSVASSNSYFMARALSGDTGSIQVACSIPPPSSGAAYFGMAGPVYTGTSGLFCGKILVNNGAAYSARGWLPRMITPCHLAPFRTFEYVTIDGVMYFCLTWTNGNNSQSQVLIDMSAET